MITIVYIYIHVYIYTYIYIQYNNILSNDQLLSNHIIILVYQSTATMTIRQLSAMPAMPLGPRRPVLCCPSG